MIRSSTQLKDKVKNLSHGDSNMAQNLIRNFVMERFLERVSISQYRDKIILKGGMLVASLIGINLRATMDIDTTFQALPLSKEDAERIVTDIINTPVNDNMTFTISNVSDIMADFEYPGVRIGLISQLDKLKQKITIDISTDDVITPAAMNYEYKLLLEKRSIEIMTYTPETVLAEKIQTIFSRGTANTRMRDYYDVYILACENKVVPDAGVLRLALLRTCKKRGTDLSKDEIILSLKEIAESEELAVLWDRYSKNNYYVGNLPWTAIAPAVTSYIAAVADKL